MPQVRQLEKVTLDGSLCRTVGWFFPDGHVITAAARTTTSYAFYTCGGHAGPLQSRWLAGLVLTQDTCCTMSVRGKGRKLHWIITLLEGFGLWQMYPEGVL